MPTSRHRLAQGGRKGDFISLMINQPLTEGTSLFLFRANESDNPKAPTHKLMVAEDDEAPPQRQGCEGSRNPGGNGYQSGRQSAAQDAQEESQGHRTAFRSDLEQGARRGGAESCPGRTAAGCLVARKTLNSGGRIGTEPARGAQEHLKSQ